MNKDELIGKQCLTVEKLQQKNKALSDRLSSIHMMLCCIGGALNDNKLKYNKAQMLELYKIDEIATCDPTEKGS